MDAVGPRLPADPWQGDYHQWCPYAVDMFGRDGSWNEERYCEPSVKTAQNGPLAMVD